MKRIATIICCAMAALWIQNAAAMGPGAATDHKHKNKSSVVKVDKQATRDRLEKKGKRSKDLRQRAEQSAQKQGK